MDRYQCPECSYIYDEEKGDMREGYRPETPWSEVEADFYCPDCGIIRKDQFDLLS